MVSTPNTSQVRRDSGNLTPAATSTSAISSKVRLTNQKKIARSVLLSTRRGGMPS
jgi:hypothetical protein